MKSRFNIRQMAVTFDSIRVRTLPKYKLFMAVITSIQLFIMIGLLHACHKMI